MDEVLRKLRERAKRTILRKIETGEISYSRSKKMFVYVETEEEYKMDNRDDSDDDADDDSQEDSDDEDEKEQPKKHKKTSDSAQDDRPRPKK